MNLIVSAAAVRDYLQLNDSDATSKYSDASIGSNIRAAQSYLQQVTGRYLVDTAFSSPPWAATTMLRAQVALPGFRTLDTVTWGGSTLTVGLPGDDSVSAWAIPDSQQTGVYTALQFRAWRTNNRGPWYLADPLWWDKNLDSPFYPGNRGGGYAYTSLPNDLLITGSAGYAAGTEPEAVLHAVKVLAAFYTKRSDAILADTIVTPAGGVINYAHLPTEVRDFIGAWQVGEQMVSVG